jgi:hypothetical protein
MTSICHSSERSQQLPLATTPHQQEDRDEDHEEYGEAQGVSRLVRVACYFVCVLTLAYSLQGEFTRVEEDGSNTLNSLPMHLVTTAVFGPACSLGFQQMMKHHLSETDDVGDFPVHGPLHAVELQTPGARPVVTV